MHEPVEEEEPSLRQERTKDEMLAFLDELTNLTRRTCIVVSSDGTRDVPTLRKITPGTAATGRYEVFWEKAPHTYPTDIIWVGGAEDPVYLIDLEGSNEDRG
jgi:hypothetical protein